VSGGRPTVIGLTGSIGMGKSTTAGFFAEEGVAVWDADAAVHRIYAPGGAGAVALKDLVPQAISRGGVRREALRDVIAQDDTLLDRIERIIHPLVQNDRDAFIAGTDADIVLCDIPLLFETGAEAQFDAIIVVTAPPDIQRARVLDRPGMTEETFRTILSRQMPDADKRARADYIIDTSGGLENAQAQVRKVLADIKASDHA